MQHKIVLKQITVITDKTSLLNKEIITMESSLVQGHVEYSSINCISHTALVNGIIESQGWSTY